MDAGENSHTQDLEFSYNANGTVAMLKYFQISESGKKLVYLNTYIYNSALEPTEITSIAQNGTKFLFTIESYSDPIDFDPLWFTGTDLSENYMIYNYPVLSAMKRLPAKITRSKITNGLLETEQIVTINSVIKGGRLEKQNTLISYPSRPGSDTSHETLYFY